MTSQMCESESKLPQSHRGFRTVILIRAYLGKRDVCSQGERRGGVGFFYSLIILKIQDLFAKFLFCFVYKVLCFIVFILENSHI